MARVPLPDRRPSLTEILHWQGREWQTGVGFDDKGRVREVFLDGVKVGSESEALLDDACILMSLLLQYGMSADDLDRHLGREGIDPTALAASIVGLLAARVKTIEAETMESA